MPTPERTTLAAIVTAARDLLEEVGVGGLTMQAVADRVGVRAPSLYKRVDGRDRLLQLVAEATVDEVAPELARETSLRGMADRFRAFGHERPAAFQLVMMPGTGAPIVDDAHRDAVTAPILRAAAARAGDDSALDAARTFTAWAAGFISMETNGGFNLGGDVERAWDFGASTIIAAISAERD